MSQPISTPTPQRRLALRALRTALGLTALLLAAVTLIDHLRIDRHRQRAYDWLAEAGVTADTAALEREDDPEVIDLKAARALLAHELSAKTRSQASPQSAVAGLNAAALRARAVLARRPASWEAAFVLGAATYAARSLGHDPRLFTAYRDWQTPLEAAGRLAPGHRAPGRILAGIYLEIWPALSPRRRELAHGLLAAAFRDPNELANLLPSWLEVAGDRSEAFAIIPNDPAAWEKVQAYLGSRGDLSGFRDARERWNRSLLALLRRDLGEADRRRAAGNVEGARLLYLEVATRARPELRYLDLVEQALVRCPPGPVDKVTAAKLAPHLTRALERCLDAGCELKPATLKRLSSFVRDLEPQAAALAALFAGDLTQAGIIERRSTSLWSEDWAPYLIAKARIFAARDDLEEARGALSQVHHDWQGRAIYWQAKADLANAARNEGGMAEAQAELQKLGRVAWGAGDWRWRKEVAHLEIVAAGDATGLSLELVEIPPSGAVVELRLDGTDLGAFAVPASALGTPLRIPVALRQGLHQLELSTSYGGQVLPGATALL